MTTWTVIALAVLAIAVYLIASGFVRTWRTYRGMRVITCPENLQPAAVKVAAFDAAKWFAVTGERDPHLRTCSRWPEMAGCGEECLSQIESNPNACLVSSIVTQWYAGKSCHYCGEDIGEIVWHERPPAVRLPNGVTREWKEVKPEELPKVFVTGDAVCWPCHLVETFRRENPQMVVERKRPMVVQHVLPPTVEVY